MKQRAAAVSAVHGQGAWCVRPCASPGGGQAPRRCSQIHGADGHGEAAAYSAEGRGGGGEDVYLPGGAGELGHESFPDAVFPPDRADPPDPVILPDPDLSFSILGSLFVVAVAYVVYLIGPRTDIVRRGCLGLYRVVTRRAAGRTRRGRAVRARRVGRARQHVALPRPTDGDDCTVATSAAPRRAAAGRSFGRRTVAYVGRPPCTLALTVLVLRMRQDRGGGESWASHS